MIVIKCDMCGVEMNEMPLDIYKGRELALCTHDNSSPLLYREKDLCDKCYKELLEWFESKREQYFMSGNTM